MCNDLIEYPVFSHIPRRPPLHYLLCKWVGLVHNYFVMMSLQPHCPPPPQPTRPPSLMETCHHPLWLLGCQTIIWNSALFFFFFRWAVFCVGKMTCQHKTGPSRAAAAAQQISPGCFFFADSCVFKRRCSVQLVSGLVPSHSLLLLLLPLPPWVISASAASDVATWMNSVQSFRTCECLCWVRIFLVLLRPTHQRLFCRIEAAVKVAGSHTDVALNRLCRRFVVGLIL